MESEEVGAGTGVGLQQATGRATSQARETNELKIENDPLGSRTLALPVAVTVQSLQSTASPGVADFTQQPRGGICDRTTE